MELVQIRFHIGYGVGCVASVLCHHIEVNERPDASESTFERHCLRTSWLAKSDGENSQNSTPLSQTVTKQGRFHMTHTYES